MKVLATVSSPAQDDVIQRILRAREEWDPPWLKSRPTRGPPGSGPSPPKEPRASIDPLPPDEDYIVDPDSDNYLDTRRTQPVWPSNVSGFALPSNGLARAMQTTAKNPATDRPLRN